MKQGGSIAEPGSEVFGISHGAQFTRSACNAGQDVNTPWPRQVGDLSGRQANNARRIGDSQRAWKGLLQPVETRRTVRTCRFTRACRPRRHRIRTWLRRSELANALCRSTLTIWWRSAQCGGVAASRGRTAVVNPPCTRPQEPSFFSRRRSEIFTMVSNSLRPMGLSSLGTGVTRIPLGGYRVPACAKRGSFAPPPRPEALSDDG